MDALAPVPRADELSLAVAQFSATLTDEQRMQLKRIKIIPDPSSIIVFTTQLDAENRSRKGGSVSSRLGAFLQSTRDFCTVVDTFASSNPSIAALVWGSVKLTLLIILKHTSYYEAISGLFMQIGRLCPLFSEYGALYKGSRPLQESLSKFQASVVRFCKHIVEATQRPWQRQLFQAFYSSFHQEFRPDADDIRNRSDDVKQAIGLAKAHIDERERQLQIKERFDALGSRKLLKTFLGRRKTEDETLRKLLVRKEERREQERRQRLLEALCAYRPERWLKQNQRKRFRDTASWIFETQEFSSWLSPMGPSILWCSGKIGSGKTIIATSVVDHLILHQGHSEPCVSYFFINSNDRESLRAEIILRSILQQNLPASTELSPETVSQLQHVVDNYNIDEILMCFKHVTHTSKPFYLVIDGMDECEKLERDNLFSALSCLRAERQNMRLFLSSRESLFKEICSRFPSLEHITMDNPGARDDIITYIDGVLQEKTDNKTLIVGDMGLVTEIREALVSSADGMFLWVSLQVDELCEQVCDEDIRKTITNLPKTLEETFIRVLRRISSRSHKSLAEKAFLWIAAAARPLCLEEMREAIAIEIGQKYTIRERLCNDVNDIVVACQNLVHVDEEDGSIQFAHHTIRDFLVENPNKGQQSIEDDLRLFFVELDLADHYIGEICVTYLHFNDFRTTLTQREKPITFPNPSKIATLALSSESSRASKLLQKRLQKGASRSIDMAHVVKASPTVQLDHPFLKYASAYWLAHTKNFSSHRSMTWDLWVKLVFEDHSLLKRPWDSTPEAVDDAILKWARQINHNALIQHCNRTLTGKRINRDARVKLVEGHFAAENAWH